MATESIRARDNRLVYLITYSQADLNKFSSRLEFAEALVVAFSHSNHVLQWCCCLEDHEDGGKQYHLAIKLQKKQRWLQVKRFLLGRFGISVHFSSVHHNYFSAWQYVTKSDPNYLQSDNHPDLSNGEPPRTNTAGVSSVLMREDSNSDSENGSGQRCRKRKKRLTSLQVSEIIQEKSIKTRTELLALAQLQKNEGKTDLAEFIMNRQPKVIAQLLKNTWDMFNAQAKLERMRKTRLELLLEAGERECVEGCEGKWLRSAQEILTTNSIESSKFAAAVYSLLEKGRGKYRNIMLTGPANCGKTFLLKPLNSIYHTFTNPASGTFAWVGVENAECIFLNDFRWNDKMIPWHDLLLLLEGEPVHFPAPKTHFAEDILLETDIPVFATSKYKLAYVKGGCVDVRETEMMSVRWKVFSLSQQIPEEQQAEITPCHHCFAHLVYQGRM